MGWSETTIFRSSICQYDSSHSKQRRPDVLYPSSRERRVAASMAARIARGKSNFSSASRPAAVVPPGDVTAARNSAGSRPDCYQSATDPAIV